MSSGSNFEFLKAVLGPERYATLTRAEQLSKTAPEWCVVTSGAAAEHISAVLLGSARWIESQEQRIEVLRSKALVPPPEIERLTRLRRQRNHAAHGGAVQEQEAIAVLRELWSFGRWYIRSRSGVDPPEFHVPTDELVEAKRRSAVAAEVERRLSVQLSAAIEDARAQSAKFEGRLARHQERESALEAELTTVTEHLASFEGTKEERAQLESERQRLDSQRQEWLERIVKLERERGVASREAGRREREAAAALEAARNESERLVAERDQLAREAEGLRSSLELSNTKAAEVDTLKTQLGDLEDPESAYAREYPSEWPTVPDFLRARLGASEDGSSAAARPPFLEFTIPRLVRRGVYAETWSVLHRSSSDRARARIATFDGTTEAAAAEVWRRETEWAHRLREAADAESVGLAHVLAVPNVERRGYCVYAEAPGQQLREWLTSTRPRRLGPALRAGWSLARALTRLADLGIACQGFAPDALVLRKDGAIGLLEPCTPEPEGFAPPEAALDEEGLPPTFSHAQLQRSFVFVAASVTTAMLFAKESQAWVNVPRRASLATLVGLKDSADPIEIAELLGARIDRLARDDGGSVDAGRLRDALLFGASRQPNDRPPSVEEWVRAVRAAGSART
jgi:hypothetical protein